MIWDCNGGGNQVWQPCNGGYRNPASGRCLDDPEASTTDGTQLALCDCNGTAAQIWSLPGAWPFLADQRALPSTIADGPTDLGCSP